MSVARPFRHLPNPAVRLPHRLLEELELAVQAQCWFSPHFEVVAVHAAGVGDSSSQTVPKAELVAIAAALIATEQLGQSIRLGSDHAPHIDAYNKGPLITAVGAHPSLWKLVWHLLERRNAAVHWKHVSAHKEEEMAALVECLSLQGLLRAEKLHAQVPTWPIGILTCPFLGTSWKDNCHLF